LRAALAFQRGHDVQQLPIIDTAYAESISLECTDIAHTRELHRVLKAKHVNLEPLWAFLSRDAIGKLPQSRPALLFLHHQPMLVEAWSKERRLGQSKDILRYH
jgi:hypothetical protein